jgi:hypothetical protein
MSAAFLRDDPESSRVCVLCGNGTNVDGSTMGKFIQRGQIVDAHLVCADRNNLHAVDENEEEGDSWMRDGE